jgi:hypothetical protein
MYNYKIIDFKPSYLVEDITYVDDMDIDMFTKTLKIIHKYHLERL